MKVFVSHAAEQRSDADRLAIALRARRHTVFLDANDLPPGGDYQSRIQQAIDSCDLFCFLISPQSVSAGRFPLSELGLVRRRWPDPTGRVVPIMVSKVPIDSVPAYLRAVSILEPQGDLVADSLAGIEALRLRPMWRSPLVIAAVGLALVAAVGGVVFFGSPFGRSTGPAGATAAAAPSDAGDQSGMRIRVADTMQQTVKGFAAHLREVGFRNASDAVTVYLYSEQMPLPADLRDQGGDVNAFYHDKTLYLHWSLSSDSSVLLREYTHFVLAESVGSSVIGDTAVESGVADYLPASYLGSPLIGEGLGPLFHLQTTYIRRLDNVTSYTAVENEAHARGEVWSGAFWACRQLVGQQAVDEAVVSAWTRAMTSPFQPDASARFGSALAKTAAPVGGCLTKEIAKRQLPHA